MSVSEFYDLSPVEFYYAMEEYSEIQMTHHKTTYDSMRLQTVFLLNVQLSKKDRIREVTQLMKFPWDKEVVKGEKKQSVEEMKQILLGIAKTVKKKTLCT